MRAERVALLGAGAIGAYIIWGMAEELGERFCVVARGERKARLEREGLVINGEQYTFPVKTPEEARGADVLFVACKQDKLREALGDKGRYYAPAALCADNAVGIALLAKKGAEDGCKKCPDGYGA